MKSEKFHTTTFCKRTVSVFVLAFHVVMSSSLFGLRSSLLHAQIEQGVASFYSKRATGSRTANGERLHHDSMTCAHRTLPFNTLLKVTNIDNGRSVIVRVNDRGPYIRGRVVDLSWGAAKKIGILTKGLAKVTVEEAYRITIPLKAPEIKIDIPKVEIVNIELPDTLKAIWQEDELIYHKRANSQGGVQKKKKD